MNLVQLLSIEITTECNLADQHVRCPNRSPDRYRHLNSQRRLDDRTIVSTAVSMYREHGFRGMIAWHYYCEPLLEQERILRLMRQIREQVPQARFLLWTNGTLIPEDVTPLLAFDRIVITDYGNLVRERVDLLLERHHGASLHEWPLDGRLQISGVPTTDSCARMFVEFVIDVFGNVHICCFDWKGQASIGNVYTHPLGTLVGRWQAMRDSIAGVEMTDAAPSICKACIHKSPTVAAMLPPIVASPEVVEDAKEYIRQLRDTRPPPIVRPPAPRSKPAATPPPLPPQQITPPAKDRKIAIVFVAYLKVPKQRLRDHFRWNEYFYRHNNARVYVVTEKQQRVPRYAECVIYPVEKLPVIQGKPRFSICATKNAGIQKALDDGADVILCIDVDHAFPKTCWHNMIAVPDTEANAPVYRMVVKHGRKEGSHNDTGATGAIAMTAANWRRTRWDERCVGYGGDDGIMLKSIQKAGLRLNRDSIIEHVEHPRAVNVKNVPGHGRDGCYGRDEFNWDNFKQNQKIYRAT